MKPKVGDIMVCVTTTRAYTDGYTRIEKNTTEHPVVVTDVGRLYFHVADAKIPKEEQKAYRLKFRLEHNGRYAFPEANDSYGRQKQHVYPNHNAHVEDLEAIATYDIVCSEINKYRAKGMSIQALKAIKAILDREANV